MAMKIHQECGTQLNVSDSSNDEYGSLFLDLFVLSHNKLRLLWLLKLCFSMLIK